MRICDRCKNPDTSAFNTFVNKREGTEIDLCRECEEGFKEFLNNAETKKSRKKENKT